MRKLLSLLFILLQASAQSLPCGNDLWPVYAGSTSQIDRTTCIAYDKLNELLIIGGTAEDQTPNSNYEQTGFLYALDLLGNWKWGGNIFYIDQHVNEVHRCNMNSDNTALSVFGVSNGQPIIIEMETASATI